MKMAKIFRKGTVAGTALSVFITMIINSVHLSTSIVVHKFNLFGGELLLFRSIFQATVYFGFAVSYLFLTKDKEGGDKWNLTARNFMMAVISNIFLGVMALICLLAVVMLPVSDFIVLCFTSPIFTLTFSAIVLKSRVTILKFTTCLVTISGAALVVQPKFIFGNAIGTNENHEQYPLYTVGVLMSLGAAVSAALSYVSFVKCENFPKPYFLLIGAVICFIISVIAPAMGAKNRVLNYYDIPLPEATNEEIKAVIGLIVVSILPPFLTVLALQLAPPVLVSVVRCMEIVMGLLVELALNEQKIDFSTSFILRISGSGLVLLSVVLMAMSEWIEDNYCQPPNKKESCRSDIEVPENVFEGEL